MRKTSVAMVLHPKEESLIRLLDGEIDKESQAVVQAHLDLCEHCRNEQGQLRCAMRRFMELEDMLLRAQEFSQNGRAGDRVGKLDQCSDGAEPITRRPLREAPGRIVFESGSQIYKRRTVR